MLPFCSHQSKASIPQTLQIRRNLQTVCHKRSPYISENRQSTASVSVSDASIATKARPGFEGLHTIYLEDVVEKQVFFGLAAIRKMTGIDITAPEICPYFEKGAACGGHYMPKTFAIHVNVESDVERRTLHELFHYAVDSLSNPQLFARLDRFKEKRVHIDTNVLSTYYIAASHDDLDSALSEGASSFFASYVHGERTQTSEEKLGKRTAFHFLNGFLSDQNLLALRCFYDLLAEMPGDEKSIEERDAYIEYFDSCMTYFKDAANKTWNVVKKSQGLARVPDDRPKYWKYELGRLIFALMYVAYDFDGDRVVREFLTFKKAETFSRLVEHVRADSKNGKSIEKCLNSLKQEIYADSARFAKFIRS